MKTNIFKKLPLLIGLALFVIIGGLQIFVRAATANLYLSPASASVVNGENLSVVVRVNTNGESVNAVQANLTYPTDKFDVLSVSGSGSAFPVEAENSYGGGNIRIARAIIGTVSGDKLVATIVFKAKVSSGTAQVSFAGGSSVIRASDNQDILSGTTGGTYTLTAPASTTPPPTSTPAPTSTTPPPATTPPPSRSSTGNTNTNNSNSGAGTNTQTPSSEPPAIEFLSVEVNDISYRSVRISYKSSVAVATQVKYGIGEQLALSASDDQLKTEHSITLPDTLSPGTAYNFLIEATASNGAVVVSNTRSFRTKGLAVTIKVVDEKDQPINKARVTLGEQTAETDSDGIAAFNDAPLGEQQVKVVAGSRTKNAAIVIADNVVDGDAPTQTFEVKVPSTPMLIRWLSLLGGLLLLAGMIVITLRKIKNKRQNQAITTGDPDLNYYSSPPQSSGPVPGDVIKPNPAVQNPAPENNPYWW